MKHAFAPARRCLALLLGSTLCAVSAHATTIDAASLEFGTGNKTKMLRLGVQSDWSSRWFASNGRHIGGHWDTTLAYWHATAHKNVPGAEQNIVDLGFTPVFRWQNDNKRGLYVEAAVGFHLLSQVYNNNGRQFSTAFQFGDHIGVGYVFENNWEVAAKIQHFSNGSIKRPNHGANFFHLKAAYRF